MKGSRAESDPVGELDVGQLLLYTLLATSLTAMTSFLFLLGIITYVICTALSS